MPTGKSYVTSLLRLLAWTWATRLFLCALMVVVMLPSELSVFKLNFASYFTIYTFYHIVYFTYISLLPSGVLSLFTSGPLYHGQFIYTFNTFRLVLFLSVVRVLIYCLPFSVIVYFCSTTLNHTAIVWPLRFGVLWEYYFPIHIPLSLFTSVIFH